MKKTILRVSLLAGLIAVFCLIFFFSEQDGNDSSKISSGLLDWVLNRLPFIDNLTPAESTAFIDKAHFFIRKLAHFSIYTVVGILIMSFLSTYKLKLFIRVGGSLAVGLLYAISDEIHQSFVPGRSPLVKDVVIDTAGVLVGILLVIFVAGLYGLISKRRSRKKEGQL